VTVQAHKVVRAGWAAGEEGLGDRHATFQRHQLSGGAAGIGAVGTIVESGTDALQEGQVVTCDMVGWCVRQAGDVGQ
jgi:hypothetical protein